MGKPPWRNRHHSRSNPKVYPKRLRCSHPPAAICILWPRSWLRSSTGPRCSTWPVWGFPHRCIRRCIRTDRLPHSRAFTRKRRTLTRMGRGISAVFTGAHFCKITFRFVPIPRHRFLYSTDGLFCRCSPYRNPGVARFFLPGKRRRSSAPG